MNIWSFYETINNFCACLQKMCRVWNYALSNFISDQIFQKFYCKKYFFSKWNGKLFYIKNCINLIKKYTIHERHIILKKYQKLNISF